MRQSPSLAGLRGIEAFTLYQKGRDLFERSHGEIDQVDGLQQANVYIERVMELVPEYWQVYADHSDLYTHLLNSSVTGIQGEGITEAVLAELELAFLSGN